MMKFHKKEVPVATSMIELAEQAQHPFQKYFSFWAAFNNIYTVVAKRLVIQGSPSKGLVSEISKDDGGNVKYSQT